MFVALVDCIYGFHYLIGPTEILGGFLDVEVWD